MYPVMAAAARKSSSQLDVEAMSLMENVNSPLARAMKLFFNASWSAERSLWGVAMRMLDSSLQAVA
jgi:hypothetical protein